MKFKMIVICAYCGEPQVMPFIDTDTNFFAYHRCACGKFIWSASKE